MLKYVGRTLTTWLLNVSIATSSPRPAILSRLLGWLQCKHGRVAHGTLDSVVWAVVTRTGVTTD